jgi:hypothetical protein
LRLWIKARACLPLLLNEFAKTGQDKFAVLFNLFVGERAECIEKYSSDPFVGLGGFSKCALKFGFVICSLGLCQKMVIRAPKFFYPQKKPAPLPHPAKLNHGEQKGGWSLRTEAFRWSASRVARSRHCSSSDLVEIALNPSSNDPPPSRSGRRFS